MAPRLQINIDPDAGKTGLPPFLDWTKQKTSAGGYEALHLAAGGTVSDTALKSGGYVNSNWNLISLTGMNLVSRYIFNGTPTIVGPTPSLAGRAMTVDWAGQTVTGIAGLNLSSIVPDLANKKGTFVLGTATQYVFRLNLNPAAGDTSPPTNWRVYETAKAAQLATYIMDPDWISYYSKFALLRLMDCMETNGSQAVDYADISTTSDQIWGGNDKANSLKTGWPVAALIEIANRTGRPIWICIPHKFTNAAVTSLLTALRDGITFSGSTVKLNIEYSNEVWNTIFSQNAYAQAQATAGGGVDDFGNSVTWTSGGSVTQARQWYGLRAAQVMEIARTVFGTDSGNKWAGKLGAFIESSAATTSALQGVAQHISVDVGAASTVANLFSNLSVAPYIGPVPGSDSDTMGLLLNGWLALGQSYFDQQLYNLLKLGAGNNSTYKTADYYRAGWQAHKTIADANGLVVDCYEGGFNCLTGSSIQNTSPLVQGLANFQRSAQAGQLTFDWMEQFVTDTVGMASQFVVLAANTKYGSWGASTSSTDFASERYNASIAHNLGVTYRQGYRNVRTI